MTVTDTTGAHDGFRALPKDARVFALARPGTLLANGQIATGKEPVPGSRGHLDARPAHSTIMVANYGWALDGQFILVDFDADHPARAEWEARCPPTWMQQTRRGTHRVYRMPDGFAGRNRKIIVRDQNGTQAIIGDLKSRGYLVGPGSAIEGGFVYTIIDARDPVPAPNWLLDLARETTTVTTGGDDGFTFEIDGVTQDRTKIEHGQNDDELIKFAGFWRRRGFAESAIAKMLMGVITSGIIEQDESRPYTAADARRIARSAATYEAGTDPAVEAAIRPESWVSGANVPLVEPPQAWWLHGFVPKSALVGLFGRGGIGKSSWLSKLAAKVTSGGDKFLHVGVEEPFRLFLARSVLLGANASRMFSIPNASRMQFPRDAKRLHDAIVESGVAFVYFDSIYSHFAGDATLPINERARAVLGSLAEIAQATGTTIFYTFHENKAGAYMGSTEMESVARCLLNATRDERGGPLRIKVAKTNAPSGAPNHHLDFPGVEVVWTDPATGEIQQEILEDGTLAPVKFILPGEPIKVSKASARLDEIEDAPAKTESKREAADRLRATGKNLAEIATELGITERQVRRYFTNP